MCTPSASIAVTRSPVRTSTSSFARSSVAAAAISSDSGGRIRGAASIERQPDVALGLQELEPVARVRARAVPNLRRELDARGARADDHDLDGRRLAARRALVGAHACSEQGGDESARHPAAESSEIARSATPGIPKSLLTLPTQNTSVS